MMLIGPRTLRYTARQLLRSPPRPAAVSMRLNHHYSSNPHPQLALAYGFGASRDEVGTEVPLRKNQITTVTRFRTPIQKTTSTLPYPLFYSFCKIGGGGGNGWSWTWWHRCPSGVVLFAKTKTSQQHLASVMRGFSSVGQANRTKKESEALTPASDAWKTMQLWKEDILVSVKLSSDFDDMVPTLFENSGVMTLQDIKVKVADSQWLNKLDECGVKRGVFLEKLGEVVGQKTATAIGTRMVPVDYEIADSELSHRADLDALFERVEETFGWYSQKPPTFVAPYFPFIQSSGMGKTKLLFELRRMLSKLEDTACELCLSGAISMGQSKLKAATKDEVFSRKLNFRNIVDNVSNNSKEDVEEQAKEAAENILQYLDRHFLSCSKRRLVLLFDEAQVLLTEKFGIEGFVFQCVRLWLRQDEVNKTSRNFHCIALFAGTTSSLANFFPNESLVSTFSSRDANKTRTFLPRGKRLPLPFYQTTTIGCFLSMNSSKKSTYVARTEYDQAVPYGRPLFAIMAEKNELESRLDTVLSRMLLSNIEDWESNQDSCLSILATRVQMGQTSTDTASDLVSKGYASLVGFSDSHMAQICYFPDPVCSRLAMAMMDEDWKMNMKGFDISGRSKRWWVERAVATFSSGLCRPNKGNAGEVFTALYLLFCGDFLRKEITMETFTPCDAAFSSSKPMDESIQLESSCSVQIPSYRHFSIPLNKWVANLIKPPPVIKPSTETTEEFAEIDPVPTNGNLADKNVQLAAAPSVSFIQVYRNYLQQYKDYDFVTSQSLLEHIYKSGTAFYTYPCCPHFDIVASIRYKHKGTFRYAPLLISVKTRDDFSPKNADANCNDMEEGLAKAKNCHRALCIVIVMCSSVASDDGDRSLKEQDIEKLFAAGEEKNIMAKVLRIGIDDAFGISRRVIDATSDGQEMSELLESHHCVRPHANESLNLPINYATSMRVGPKNRKGAVFLETLVEQLKGVPKG